MCPEVVLVAPVHRREVDSCKLWKITDVGFSAEALKQTEENMQDVIA